MPQQRLLILWIKFLDNTLICFFKFIDDILIYSRNKNEHMDHFRIVMQVLKDQQLFAKFSNCELLVRYVAFHGYIFSKKSIEVDPKKIDTVKSLRRPLTHSDIRIFLGFPGFYRRFV